MKRATPPCSSTALLLTSSPPCTMFLALTTATASAMSLDDFGSPLPTAPSAFTNPPADLKAALDVLTLPPANQGATVLPNGVFGARNTPRADNVLPPNLQTSFKIPTNGKPSRLFGAQPYTQQLLLLEEFGTEKLDPTLPTPTSYALVGCVHPGADVPRLHRPGNEHLSEHHPAIRQPVSGGITGRLFALIGALFILPVTLMYTFQSYYVFRGKGRVGDGYY